MQIDSDPVSVNRQHFTNAIGTYNDTLWLSENTRRQDVLANFQSLLKMKLWDHTIRSRNKVFDFDEYQQTMESVPS